MKCLYFSFAILLVSLSVHAQTLAPSRNSFRIGLDAMSLDVPDDLGSRLVARYARHLGRDRIVIGAEAGYLYTSSQNSPFNGIDPGPDRRKRLTADLTVLFDFLPGPRHALRLGGGFSAWYRNDDVYRGAMVIDGGAAIDRWQTSAINLGPHLTSEYELLILPQWSVGFRVAWANLNEAGISSIAGINTGYRF